MKLFISLLLFISLVSSGSNNCDIENIEFKGNWTVTHATYEDRVSSVQEQNRRDVGYSSHETELLVNQSIHTMQLQFLTKDTVIWTTPLNTHTINFNLDRENSEINLRTGYTHHKIEVLDCNHFRLIEDNLALGYIIVWQFKRNGAKGAKSND